MRGATATGGPSSLLGADPSQLGDARIDRAVVRRVVRFAAPYRWMLLGFMAILVLQALVGIVPPLLFKGIIDDAIGDQNRTVLHVLASLAVLAAIAAALLAFCERWVSARIGEGVIYDLRVAVFDHVQRMPLAFFTRTQTGALTSRLNNDVVGAQRALTGTLGSVVSNTIVLVTTLAAMLALEWRLTLFALVALPMFILPAKRVGRRLQAITREQMDLNAAMSTTMTERFNVSGALLVKLFGRHGEERDRFAERADGVRATGVKAALYGRTFFLAMGFVAAVATAAVYWIGGALVIDGAIEVGTLVALAAYVTRLYGPLTALTNARVDVMSAIVSFDRVFEVLDTPNPLDDRPGAVDLGEVAGRIEVDELWFRYPSEPLVATLELDPNVAAPSSNGADVPEAVDGGYVLRGVDATIEPGQTVALVGPSGGGKSTLASLVPRLYDVTEGAVRVDGVDVRDVTQASLRRVIGVVAQDPHLFHDTVANNLRYARPDATSAHLERACRAAQIHEVIAALPEGYDTVVGERGYRLSGGEKQRLAIARMLVKDPAVVILDEATSHLDSENEALVQRALAEGMAGRTSLVIAHRLSTITEADLILVVDRGRIVERGRHHELLLQGGLYAELYRTLVGDELVGDGSLRPAPSVVQSPRWHDDDATGAAAG
ncbi:MAG: ABC transporter ATP-binding protein [Acidimicrobiales bacterium]